MKLPSGSTSMKLAWPCSLFVGFGREREPDGPKTALVLAHIGERIDGSCLVVQAADP